LAVDTDIFKATPLCLPSLCLSLLF